MDRDLSSKGAVSTDVGNPYFSYTRSTKKHGADRSFIKLVESSFIKRRSSFERGAEHRISLPWLMVGLLVLITGVAVGIVIGYFGLKLEKHCAENITSGSDESKEVNDCFNYSWDNVLSNVNVFKLREHLREFTSAPYVTRLSRDNELVNIIETRLKQYWMDEIKIYSYDVLLSNPNPNFPNMVRLIDENNDIRLTTSYAKEETKGARPSFLEHAFNAYAAQGLQDEVEKAHRSCRPYEPLVGALDRNRMSSLIYVSDQSQVCGDDIQAKVQAELVYVNYARVEDFEILEKLGVSVSGYICMARYGKIFRANQVLNAQERGALGVIFFSNPEDEVPVGTSSQHIYPNTLFLPSSSIQKGSVFLGNGDPLTPSWPSKKGAYRISVTKSNVATIPSQPIGFKDAKHMLRMLVGKEAPKEWEGGIKNVHVGPGFTKAMKARKVRLEVQNSVTRQTIKNIIGVIKGSREPDRYVIVGNHRDAWGYGASDPSSGTAQLLETARVLGEHKHRGWRPSRSILFASWAAEEYGVIGSQEWVEEMGTILTSRGVAMINTDTCASGPDLDISASPVLYNVAVRATKKVISPSKSNVTLFEDWCRSKATKKTVEDWRLMTRLNPTNDDAPFSFYAGVPVIDISFRSTNVGKAHNTSKYSTHNMGQNTFYTMEKMVDPTFVIHKACSQLVMSVALDLADTGVFTVKSHLERSNSPSRLESDIGEQHKRNHTFFCIGYTILLGWLCGFYDFDDTPAVISAVILPFDVRSLADAISRAYDDFRNPGFILKLLLFNISFDELGEAVKKFSEAAYSWHDRLLKETKHKCVNPLRARILNDQLMQVEKAFILPEGLPGNTYNRHLVFSPSSLESYYGNGFYCIKELFFKLEYYENDVLRKQSLTETLKKQVSDVMLQITQASHILQPL